MMRLRSGSGLFRGAAPVLVVSPHLDDAVMSCGCLIAGLARHREVDVATVFAGRPHSRDGPPTEWDRAAGLASCDAVGARREEDRAALAALHARHRWLPFADSQYGKSPRASAIARRMASLPAWRASGAAVLFPLGLFHSDHRLAHDAVLALLRRRPRPLCLAYEDALYRRLPGLCDAAIARLRRRGFAPRRARVAADAAALRGKARAVACYRSQLRALATPGRPGLADLCEEERYWRLLSPHRHRYGVGA